MSEEKDDSLLSDTRKRPPDGRVSRIPARRAAPVPSWEKRARNESGEWNEASQPRARHCPIYPDGSPVNECWDQRGFFRASRAAKEEEQE